MTARHSVTGCDSDWILSPGPGLSSHPVSAFTIQCHHMGCDMQKCPLCPESLSYQKKDGRFWYDTDFKKKKKKKEKKKKIFSKKKIK